MTEDGIIAPVMSFMTVWLHADALIRAGIRYDDIKLSGILNYASIFEVRDYRIDISPPSVVSP